MQKLTLNFRLLTGAILLVLAASSCSKVDEWTADPNDIKSVNAEYYMELSQTWFDYYDITVTYYDENAQPHSFTPDTRWSYKISKPPKSAPRNFAFTVIATPKKDMPVPQLPIVFSQHITAEFFALQYDGNIYKNLASDLHPISNSSTDTRTLDRESAFQQFIDFGPRTLFGFNYSWSGYY